MAKTFVFLVFMFAFVLVFGFVAGYFVDRSSIIYTQNEMDVLKNEIESMQLQELFVSAGESSDCMLIYSTMGKISYDLYDLVDRLKQTPPGSTEFMNMKKGADMLSLKAWMIAKKIKKTCSSDIVPILFLYSGNCTGCNDQDAALKSVKEKYKDVLVYAIDYDLNEPATELIKAAYDIKTSPSMIIDSTPYENLTESELESIVCGSISCQPSS
jgi:hypothetical protein